MRLSPPIWAGLTHFFGIETGAVALVAIGVYIAAGNKRELASKVTFGLLLGIPWAIIGKLIIEANILPVVFSIVVQASILGASAVIIGSLLHSYLHPAALLAGWGLNAIVFEHTAFSELGTLPLQSAFAIIVGVYVFGVGIGKIEHYLMNR